jgi:hypothetical protein
LLHWLLRRRFARRALPKTPPKDTTKDISKDAPKDISKDTSINDLKTKIFDAKTVQQRFTSGLHCSELNGTDFYFQPRDRVLNLEEYHRSLENFVSEGMYNAETRRPWTKQDADARWAQVLVQARADQANCVLVASLPLLQKKLDEMQQQANQQQAPAPQSTAPGK